MRGVNLYNTNTLLSLCESPAVTSMGKCCTVQQGFGHSEIDGLGMSNSGEGGRERAGGEKEGGSGRIGV